MLLTNQCIHALLVVDLPTLDVSASVNDLTALWNIHPSDLKMFLGCASKLNFISFAYNDRPLWTLQGPSAFFAMAGATICVRAWYGYHRIAGRIEDSAAVGLVLNLFTKGELDRFEGSGL